MSAIKKTLSHPKADEEARRIFQDKIKGYQAASQSIVYIDESGFAYELLRTHGYAPVGERCVGKHDGHAKGRTNVIGALLASCLLTTTLFTGTITADVFFAWLSQDLLPKLPTNSVIVMDNAPFHKRADFQHLIEQLGHLLEFLPPYSPDLNPIEHKWAQAKALRRQKKCSIDELFTQLF
jgi:transposase